MYSTTLNEQYQLAEVASCITNLLALDKVWTNHLETSNELHESDVLVLQELTNNMNQLLTESKHQFQQLKELVKRHPELFEQIHEKLISDNGMTKEQKENWKFFVQRNGGIVTYITEAMDTIVQQIPREQELMQSKIQTKIKNGGFVSGDFSFGCGLYAGLALVAAATGNVILAAGAATAAVGACAHDV
ncbi:hypothetical protein [Paenibacillus oleatilyticus]|uniref:hypothetical protein n=1 Tax=Paenibacillus oleatilyticus TaxID=2594886 RepID=UPI001C1F3414|nr:hypothetical protein [Paenibacillus oleatilyticus]MBU7319519.1 hypothetical protein [Paenibacillus oleatilyticus]